MALNMTTANATMRAVAWQGNPYSVGVVDLPRPTIINQTDAIVQIARAAICGLKENMAHKSAINISHP